MDEKNDLGTEMLAVLKQFVRMVNLSREHGTPVAIGVRIAASRAQSVIAKAEGRSVGSHGTPGAMEPASSTPSAAP